MSAESKLAANADIYQQVFEAVEALGYTVKWSSGWATRSASHSEDKIVKPTCGITHHTASNNTSTSYIQNGDPGRGLTGPLANVHIPRDGVINVLGCGYQNHAGNNHKPCYDRMVDGTAPLDRDLVPGADGDFSANRYALAIEVNGDGGSDDYTDEQYAAVVAIFTELHRVMGWNDARVGAHKELTTRKPDDPVRSMGTLRTDVLAALSVPPVPLPPVDVDMRVVSYNAQAKQWGGGSYTDDAKFVADTLSGSVVFGQEMEESCRDAIRDETGFKVWAIGYVAVFWDPDKYDYDDTVEADFGTAYHGMIGTHLTRLDNDETFTAASIHVRPNDSFPADWTDEEKVEGKLGDVQKACDELADFPTVVIGGDFNTGQAQEVMEANGYTLVTPDVDTIDKDGTQRLDAIYMRGRLVDRTGGSIVKTSTSDHHGLVSNLTLPAGEW